MIIVNVIYSSFFNEYLNCKAESLLFNSSNAVLGGYLPTSSALKIILFSAVFELLFKHGTPKKVVISECVQASEFFLEKVQISYLNAILDKLSKVIRKDE